MQPPIPTNAQWHRKAIKVVSTFLSPYLSRRAAAAKAATRTRREHVARVFISFDRTSTRLSARLSRWDSRVERRWLGGSQAAAPKSARAVMPSDLSPRRFVIVCRLPVSLSLSVYTVNTTNCRLIQMRTRAALRTGGKLDDGPSTSAFRNAARVLSLVSTAAPRHSFPLEIP